MSSGLPELYIERLPDASNMARHCGKCWKEKRAGFRFFWENMEHPPEPLFVCDDCLQAARSAIAATKLKG